MERGNNTSNANFEKGSFIFKNAPRSINFEAKSSILTINHFKENDTLLYFNKAIDILSDMNLDMKVLNQIKDFHQRSIKVLREETEQLSLRFWNMIRGGTINLLTRLSYEEFESKFLIIQNCSPSSCLGCNDDEWEIDKTLYWHQSTFIHHKLIQIPLFGAGNMHKSNLTKEEQFRITFLVIFDVPLSKEDKEIDHQLMDLLFQCNQIGCENSKIGLLIPIITENSSQHFSTNYSALLPEFSGQLVKKQMERYQFEFRYYIKLPPLIKILVLSRLAEMNRLLTKKLFDNLLKRGTYSYDDCLCVSHLLQNYRAYSLMADLFEINLDEKESNKPLDLIYKQQLNQSLDYLFRVFEILVSSGIDWPSINLICTFCTINWGTFLPNEWKSKFSFLFKSYANKFANQIWLRSGTVDNSTDHIRFFMAALVNHMRKIKVGTFFEEDEYYGSSINLPPLMFVTVPSILVIRQNEAIKCFQQTGSRNSFEQWKQAFADILEMILEAASNASLSCKTRNMRNTKYAEKYFWDKRIWIEGPYREYFYGTSSEHGVVRLYKSFIPRQYIAHLIFKLYNRTVQSGLLTNEESLSFNETLRNFLNKFNGSLLLLKSRNNVFLSRVNGNTTYSFAEIYDEFHSITYEDNDDNDTEEENEKIHYTRMYKKKVRMRTHHANANEIQNGHISTSGNNCPKILNGIEISRFSRPTLLPPESDLEVTSQLSDKSAAVEQESDVTHLSIHPDLVAYSMKDLDSVSDCEHEMPADVPVKPSSHAMLPKFNMDSRTPARVRFRWRSIVERSKTSSNSISTDVVRVPTKSNREKSSELKLTPTQESKSTFNISAATAPESIKSD